MKSSGAVVVKSKLHEVKDKTEEKLGNLTNDPTLDGKDENKIGRFQSKTPQAHNDIKK